MTSSLAAKQCIPCRGGVPPLPEAEAERLLADLGGDWTLVENHHLQKTYTFEAFMDAVHWVNKLAAVAEEQGHHPVILINFKKVQVDIWTHKIDGLTESDFYLAAKADAIK